MDLKYYVSLVWRWLWLVILCALLGAGTAFTVSYFTTPVYRASTLLLVSQASANRLTPSVTSDVLVPSEELARTYSHLIVTRPVLEETIARLGLTMSPEQLKSEVSVQLVDTGQLVQLNVEDTNPRLAAFLANTIPLVFGEQNRSRQAGDYASSLQNLESQLASLNDQIVKTQAGIDAIGPEPASSQQEAELVRLQTALTQYRTSYASLLESYENLRLIQVQSSDNVTVVEKAMVPSVPVRPQTVRNTILAGLVGVLLAAAVIFLVEYLDDTIKSPEQMAAVLELATLGVMMRLPRERIKGGEIISIAEPRSPYSEAFRSLRTNIQYSSVDQQLRTILVGSMGPGEGKSTVAANLAAVFAQAGQKVVIVDGDMRRPSLHRLFNLTNRSGLAELMLKLDFPVEQALQPTILKNLAVLTTGHLPPNPAELLGSDRMLKILERLNAMADVVIIDSPPIGAVTDAVVLSRRVDGLVLVVETGVTRMRFMEQGMEQLRRVGAHVLGVVMNKVVTSRGGGYYSYYYNYGYYDRTGGKRTRSSRDARGRAAPKPETAAPGDSA
jgi:non-specific protein-tyrosine kinase